MRLVRALAWWLLGLYAQLGDGLLNAQNGEYHCRSYFSQEYHEGVAENIVEEKRSSNSSWYAKSPIQEVMFCLRLTSVPKATFRILFAFLSLHTK